PGVHRRRGLLSPRRVERELNERDELVQRLLFRKFAGREPPGQVERAEFEREPPMQYVDVAREHRGKLARQRIDPEVYRAARHRVFERDRAGNAERPQPREAVGKIAEALAEE